MMDIQLVDAKIRESATLMKLVRYGHGELARRIAFAPDGQCVDCTPGEKNIIHDAAQAHWEPIMWTFRDGAVGPVVAMERHREPTGVAVPAYSCSQCGEMYECGTVCGECGSAIMAEIK